MKKTFSIFLIFFTFSIYCQNLTVIADSLRIKYKIPEIAFAVVSVDSIIEMQTLGFHKIESNKKEDEAKINDYFHLGSNTKAITGFICAYLVEQNKINWETKFFDLFPKWKKKSNKAFCNITLEDLLSHRARIQPFTSGNEYKKLPKFVGTKSEKRKQFCKYLLKNEPLELNDKTFNYSNAGYSIATLMLEKVSGRTWEELVNLVLKEKLKLNYKLGWPNRFEINQPWGHWIENDTLKSLSPNTKYDLSLAEPAGDLSMQLNDYAKFVQSNLIGLEGKDNFLKSETYDYLHYGKKEYSIGWGNVKDDKREISEHAGSDGTFFCYTQIDKIRKNAFIIQINCATEEGQKGLFELLKIIKVKYGS